MLPHCPLRRLCVVFFFGILLLGGCGYRPLKAAFPEGNGRIVVPLVRNRTPYVGIITPFTTALRLKTNAAGIRVTKDNAPRLIATVVKITATPGMLGRDGNDLYPIDKIQTIVICAHVDDTAGETLIPESCFEASGRSLAGQNAYTEITLESQRRFGILEDIAEMIVTYLFSMH